jgi:UDP-N-acetylmuramate: L-alanyl-gamma-D-glutamyl-meso-diaminopimelate ligase
VARLAHDLRPADVVVVLSNGGFGGIHGRLLDAIGRERD